MGADEFAALGTAMGRSADAALGIDEAVVAEACAEAELQEDLEAAALNGVPAVGQPGSGPWRSDFRPLEPIPR